MTMHVDTFQEGEFERGPWLEILPQTEGKSIEERLEKLRDTTPSWAHGTPEDNPHYPYEGPAMDWVHA